MRRDNALLGFAHFLFPCLPSLPILGFMSDDLSINFTCQFNYDDLAACKAT